jgi:hypothetical protein
MALLVEENSFFSKACLRKNRASKGRFEAAFNLDGRMDRTISHSRVEISECANPA